MCAEALIINYSARVYYPTQRNDDLNEVYILLQNTANRGISGALVAVLALTAAGSVSANDSYADEETEVLEAQIKSSAEAYNAAVARQAELEDEISELDSRIAAIGAALPDQQARADESARALYKYEYDTSSMLLNLLDSSSITDMLATLDSYNWIIEYNNQEISDAVQMQQELQDSRDRLESSKADADEAASVAYNSLLEAQAAREQAAARAAAMQAAEQQAKQAEITQFAEAILDSPTATEEEKEQAAATVAAAQEAEEEASEAVSSDNVGWADERTTFINEWGARIDSYLAGTAMEGCGNAYAAAAWDNGVDPRWAPAISYVESGVGAACFRSHNAWGYGSSGFSSWEEGINTVVASLGSSLYGGYLTREAASTYCPTSPEDWYNTCAEQMAMI